MRILYLSIKYDWYIYTIRSITSVNILICERLMFNLFNPYRVCQTTRRRREYQKQISKEALIMLLFKMLLNPRDYKQSNNLIHGRYTDFTRKLRLKQTIKFHEYVGKLLLSWCPEYLNS